MGRDTTADATPLLKNAEQNIGNSVTLLPQSGPATVTPQTTPGVGPRLIQLAGGSAAGQTTSVVLTASRILGVSPPGTGGPVTAILEFGNGGRSTRAEIDIPMGPYVAGSIIAGVSSAQEPQDGGIIITVPTGVLRIYARYDNQFIQPILGTNPPQSIAQVLGVPFLGPSGVIPSEPVLVKAMTAYFTRHFSRAYRTQYCYRGPLASIPVQLPPNRFTIPAFAQFVKTLRSPITALTVNIYDSFGNHLDQVAVPAGESPDIELTGTAHSVEIVNTLANAVSFLALSYEIGL